MAGQGGILYRLVQALTAALVFACVVCGYLGVRAIVWRHESELPALLTSALTITGIIALVLGVIYLIFGARSLRLLTQFDWMSVQLGLVVGMLLYGIYNAISPLLPTYAREDAMARLLQGAVDGALIGVFIGTMVGIISPKPTLLTRGGIVRYGALFLLVLALVSAVIFVSNQPSIPRNLGVWLLIPLVIVARIGVTQYDRRQERGKVEEWE
jgi:hypothetical protein